MPILSSFLPYDIRPHGNEEVKVINCGNVIELQSSQFHSKGSQIRKLNADEYFDIRTGEVKNFEHQEKRLDDTKSLKRSFADARRIINANITDPAKCRFITLTYAENMRNEKKLYNDFQNFWKRKIRPTYPNTEYIIAAEPQARGAWHLHMLLLFPDEAPFIQNEQLAKMWGHGFVSVRAIDKVDNIGAYLVAYLADIPVEEYTDIQNIRASAIVTKEHIDDDGNLIPKKVVKGARLSLYPVGMHVFRWSSGIQKPQQYYTTADRAQTLVGDLQPCYEATKTITDTESGFTNIINYRQFNKKRKETP
ncbi:MAG: hypothetical protein IJD06_02670 [Clostridia bacterium]|nr:hypothetical protein [Clostridia bacterium]